MTAPIERLRAVLADPGPLYWHCLACGAHEPVEPTGDGEEYALGDHEPCIDCGGGTAHVVTLRLGAAYEQGRALGLGAKEAWARALDAAIAAALPEAPCPHAADHDPDGGAECVCGARARGDIIGGFGSDDPEAP